MTKHSTPITVLELTEKYLSGLGLPKETLKINLLPEKYEDLYSFQQLKKSNILPSNKLSLRSNTTHMVISIYAWPMFFQQTVIDDYHLTGNQHKTCQQVRMFEANIHQMLERRQSTSSPILEPCSPSGHYNISEKILEGETLKWVNQHNNRTQLHISTINDDSSTFKDFRLGIQLDDWILFLKEKHSDIILCISFPAEFVNPHHIKSCLSDLTPKQLEAIEEKNNAADSDYIRAATGSIQGIQTPLKQLPPAPPKKNRSGKPRYSGKAQIGKGALEKAGFICENCGRSTFTSRRTNNNFMEPHHLIPISKQGLYPAADIDITSNLICLCPNCHSQFHYGMPDDIRALLSRFLRQRSNDLHTCGIDIDETTLFAYYRV